MLIFINQLINLIINAKLNKYHLIANIYFLVRIVTADDQGFDTWWKLLSLIGYIFYITAGSILFFIIAPDLEINFEAGKLKSLRQD